MDRFELSFTELDLLGDVLGLDVRPFPFTFPSVGRDWDTRLQAGLRANEAMTERGLVRDGRFIPELERAVMLLACGQVGVGVIGTGDRGEIIARGSTDGRAAMIAQQWGDDVRMTLGRAEDLVPWLLGLLPRYPRGTGDSATIPLPAAAAACARDDDFAEFSHIRPVRAARSTRERDRKAAARILASKQLGSGYFLVDGSRAVQYTLNWIDAGAGRYASFSTFDGAGNESVVYTPADVRLLGQKLHGYVEAANAGTGAGGVRSHFR